jgi:hypothetical protein
MNHSSSTAIVHRDTAVRYHTADRVRWSRRQNQTAQSLELCYRCCFYFCPCYCQFHHRQLYRPCRRRCSPYRRSLASLCRGNLDLLSVLRARDDRALRLSFRHAALMWGYYVGKRLPQTNCCSSVQEMMDKQRQLVFLLLGEDRGRHENGISKRYLGYRIERL